MANSGPKIVINSAQRIVKDALKSLVSNGDGTFRCYPRVAPAMTERPYIVFTGAGGQSVNYLENDVEAQQNRRIQVNVWADDAITAEDLMQSVIGALTLPPINATSIGAPTDLFEQDTKLYGARQDFSIWFTP